MHPFYFFLFLFCLFLASAFYYFLFPSIRTKHFILGTNKREYFLHTPLFYKDKPSEKIPLVIALHAYTDNPRQFELYSGWSRKADQKKFMVVYPKGTRSEKYPQLSWNGDFCCGGGTEKNADDVKFISELIDELTKNYSIDPQRIYVTGFSNGGILAYKIASEIPQKITAIGVIASSNEGKSAEDKEFTRLTPPSRHIPVIMMHGKLDETIPFDGGLNQNKEKDFKSFENSEKNWLKTYDCETNTKSEVLVPETVTTKKYFCGDSLLMQSIVFNKGKHVWFGSILEFLNVLTGRTLNATDLIWNFFEEI